MKSLFLALFLAGLGLFLFTTDLHFQSSTTQSLGLVQKTSGMVMGRTPSNQLFENLQDNSPLFDRQKIVTGFDSRCQFQFGDSFSLEANSSVTLFQQANRLQVHLLSGSIKRVGPTSKTDIIRVDHKEASILGEGPEKDSEPKPSSQTEGSTEVAKQFQQNLDQTFKRHQRFVEKCFIKHYEKSQGQTHGGLVMMRFQILENGRLKDVKILKSQYEDPGFHSCLREVVSRVRFKRYRLGEKTVDFPIHIRLPQTNS